MELKTICKCIMTTGLLMLSFLLFSSCSGRQAQAVPKEEPVQPSAEVQVTPERTPEEAWDGVSSAEESAKQTLEERISNLTVAPTRADYSSDESYANFRPVEMGNIAAGVLYRCSAPLVGALSGEDRAGFVDAFLREAGVRSVMNMAYTEEELSDLLSGEAYADSYYKTLHDEGNIYTVKMPYGYADEGFSEGLIGGLTFLSEHEPPYAFHCHGGKDRTGFTAMILEMLMGAAPDEIITDYMETYTNFYGIEPGSEEYDLLAERNIVKTLCLITEADSPAALEEINLQEKAKEYLLSCGMEEDALNRLISRLSSGI